MAKRFKQYRLRMAEEEFERLETLSSKLNMRKSDVIRHSLRAADMSLICLEEHKEKIRQAYYGGFTHAQVYVDTDAITINNSKLLKSCASMIKTECKKHQNCQDCPMFDKYKPEHLHDKTCPFFNSENPEDWLVN